MALGLRHVAWKAVHLTELEARTCAAVFQRPASAQAPDVEAFLYSGFIGPAGRRMPDWLRSLGGDAHGGKRTAFDDARLQQLFFRYRARN